MSRRLPLINLIALLITVAVNFFSNTPTVNGETPGSISERYPTLIAPAPYAFGIWIFIYLMLGAFTVSHLGRAPKRRMEVMQVGWWFLASCAANCGWIFAWLYGLTGLSVLLMITQLCCLLRIVQRTDMEMTDALPDTVVLLWWPFCIYLGWIVFATVVNIAIWLVKIGWTGWGITASAGTIIMIVVAGVAYLCLTWLRNMRESGLVGVWALVAVAVADRSRAPIVSTVAWGMAAVLFFSSMIHAYRNRKLAPFRKR
jgi:hypothetical protein